MSLSPAESAALARFRAGLMPFGERIQSIVLFGSRARGEGHEDSDVDVLVLLQCAARSDTSAIMDLAYAIELDTGVAISPLVRDAASWSAASPLASEIARDGVPL